LFHLGWFRSALLWLSRGLGYIGYWLRRGWILLLVVVTVICLWRADTVHLLSTLGGPWLQWWKVLLIDAVFLILWLGIQTRKRTVVEEFVDFMSPNKPGISNQTGNQSKGDDANQFKSITKGLAILLVVRLSQVRESYKSGNTLEQRPIQTDVGSVRSFEAPTNLDDVKGFLKDAVSAESKFSFGFFQIPLAACRRKADLRL
jgi:hypothetical protein